jgi:hypothetical protein
MNNTTNVESVTASIEPYDPSCQRYAKDMEHLDYYRENAGYVGEELTRAQYIIQEEGTYNSKNGHFLCDACYIKAGMPTAPWGWVCP